MILRIFSGIFLPQVCVCVCMCVRMCVCVCVCVCLPRVVCVCVLCVYVYIYMYIHTYMRKYHTCVLIMYILRQVLSPNWKKDFYPTIMVAKMIGKVEVRRSSRQRSCLGLRFGLRTCRRSIPTLDRRTVSYRSAQPYKPLLFTRINKPPPQSRTCIVWFPTENWTKFSVSTGMGGPLREIISCTVHWKVSNKAWTGASSDSEESQ